MKEKKGALATNVLVTLIILVLGFVIVFYFLVMFDWTGTVNEEVCHQSVIYRASLPSLGGAKEYVPLKCKTDKICITSGFIGGECKEFENLEGVTTMRVSNLEDIEQILAREILSCWSMMGEGKVKIFGQSLVDIYGFGKVGSSCVICNRIAFDRESLEKSKIDLNKLDLLDYMQRHAAPGRDISYYSYLAGTFSTEGLGGLSVEDLASEEDFKKAIEDYQNSVTLSNPEKDLLEDLEQIETSEIEEVQLDSTELAVVFMQVSAPKEKDVLKNTLLSGLAVLGVTGTYKPGYFVTSKTVTNPIMRNSLGQFVKGSGAKATQIGGTLFSKIIGITAIIGLTAQYGNVLYNQEVAAGYCGDVSIGDDAREGCSVVRTMNYDLEDISRYCSVIESIS